MDEAENQIAHVAAPSGQRVAGAKDEREEFEAFAAKKFGRGMLARTANGFYAWDDVSDAWRIWQVAWASLGAKNARRYLWLRVDPVLRMYEVTSNPYGAPLDEAIDAAIAKAEGQA